jgi:predicted RNase H-like nuclease (RuvC/YqgF family)
MRCRFRGLAAGMILLAAMAAHAQDEPTTPARSRQRPAPARPSPQAEQVTEDRAFLRQLADAQRSLGEQVQQLKDAVEALQGEIGAQKDKEEGTEQEVKALRDEVKGLYVESSTVREHIDALKDDIADVNSNVSAFRSYSGFFIAVMILLLAVIFVLTIRR